MKSSHKNKTLVRRVQVVLHMHNISALKLLSDARSYVAGISAHAKLFQKPLPDLAEMRRLIAELDTACVQAQTGNRASFSLKRAAMRKLYLAVSSLGIYVEYVANKNPEQGQNIIGFANMSVKKAGRPSQQNFALIRGKHRGELTLKALAGSSRSTNRFEISTNPDLPEAWIVVQQNTRAKAVVRGLVPGTRYYARVIRTDNTGSYQVGPVLSFIAD